MDSIVSSIEVAGVADGVWRVLVWGDKVAQFFGGDVGAFVLVFGAGDGFGELVFLRGILVLRDL